MRNGIQKISIILLIMLISCGFAKKPIKKPPPELPPPVVEPVTPPPDLGEEPLPVEPNFDRYKTYQSRYDLPNVYTKKIDNYGRGTSDLDGTRNFRVVLHGILYRGGGNNLYRKEKRDNMNPLPPEGITNLCQEGFDHAIYLYTTNFKPHTENCVKREGLNSNKEQKLEYLQISPFGESGIKKLLTLVHERILDESKGPIYAHCWNGWHASGLISALSLRQFCGVDSQDAVDYWNENTDGVDEGSSYDKIRQTIRDFKPYSNFKISNEIQNIICPKL